MVRISGESVCEKAPIHIRYFKNNILGRPPIHFAKMQNEWAVELCETRSYGHLPMVDSLRSLSRGDLVSRDIVMNEVSTFSLLVIK